jgi:hypothetical protein
MVLCESITNEKKKKNGGFLSETENDEEVFG